MKNSSFLRDSATAKKARQNATFHTVKFPSCFISWLWHHLLASAFSSLVRPRRVAVSVPAQVPSVWSSRQLTSLPDPLNFQHNYFGLCTLRTESLSLHTHRTESDRKAWFTGFRAVGTQYVTCFTSHFWRREFRVDCYNLEKLWAFSLMAWSSFHCAQEVRSSGSELR